MACAGCTDQSISVPVVALHWHRVKLFKIEDLFAHVWNLLLELANIWILLLHNLLHQHWLVRLANRRQRAISTSLRAIPQDRLLLLLVVADVRIEFRYAFVQLLVLALQGLIVAACLLVCLVELQVLELQKVDCLLDILLLRRIIGGLGQLGTSRFLLV